MTGKCLACGVWTDLPHADAFCDSCYQNPWKIRDVAEIGAKWNTDSSIETWFPFSAALLNTGKVHHEIMSWLEAGKYRQVMHRHDGAFRLVDQALNISFDGESLQNIVAHEHWKTFVKCDVRAP